MDFCPRVVMDAMIKEYRDTLYPLIPVVHLPSFESDLQRERQGHDPVFLMILISLGTLVVAIMPRKLPQYSVLDASFVFNSPGQFIDHAYLLVTQLKRLDYYDTFSFEKWVIAYLWSAIYGFSGLLKRAKIASGEAHTILLSLGCHQTTTYAHLDFIATQLYKRAFWLMHTSYT